MVYSSETGFSTTLLFAGLNSLRRHSRQVGTGLLLLSFIFGVRTLFVGAFDDDGFALAVAQQMARGSVLYRDTFNQHFPLLYYWAAALVAVLGPSVFALRLAMLVTRTACFAVALRFSRFYVPIGLAAFTWGLIAPLYWGNMIVYDALNTCLLTLLFAVVLAATLYRIRLGPLPLAIIGVVCALVVLANPLAVFPAVLALAALALSPVGLRKTMIVSAVALSVVGACLIYLLALGSFKDFFTQTINFNSQSYGQYTNTRLVRMLGNMAGQAVTLVGVFDGRWFNADPLMALAGTATIDRWLFTGFVFRLSVVLCSLVLLFRRRFVAAAFAYLFPITLFARTDEGFHAMPFVVVALVLGWGLVTGEWLKTEPDFAPTPPASRRAGWVQSVLRVGNVAGQVAVGVLLAWLTVRGVALSAGDQQDVTYAGNFGNLERESHVIQILGCNKTARLTMFPYSPYHYFLSGMQPVGHYSLMFPWMTEVYLPDFISELQGTDAIVCVDQEGKIWGRKNKDYLAPLIDYLEMNFVRSAGINGCYLSPSLAKQCPNTGLDIEVSGTEFSQSFFSSCANLNQLSFFIESGQHPLALHLHDLTAEADVADMVVTAVPSEGIQEDLLKDFVFGPITDSAGKTYLATLTMENEIGESRMKSWVSHDDAYADGEAAIQGQSITGDFVFRYSCAP